MLQKSPCRPAFSRFAGGYHDLPPHASLRWCLHQVDGPPHAGCGGVYVKLLVDCRPTIARAQKRLANGEPDSVAFPGPVWQGALLALAKGSLSLRREY